MKRLLLVIVIVFVLAGCSTAPAAPAADAASPADARAESATATPVPPADGVAPANAAEAVISTDFDDAASLRNQLAYGTLKLAGTAQAITPQQAQALLPLWQAMLALSGTSESAPEELTAVQTQIIESLTPEQIQAIVDLKITNTALTGFYEENGIVMPTPAPGVTKVPGAMKNLSPEARQATRTAMEASGTAGQGTGQLTKTLLFEKVVQLLAERAAQ